MLGEGLEPSHPCGQWILSPSRLPFRHPSNNSTLNTIHSFSQCYNIPMSRFYEDKIFWIEVEKIKPNPFQPRREFSEDELRSLADSIRQYGVLQALVVTRKELQKEDGGLSVEYELIAGERRLRAARLAGLFQVPVLIKVGEESDLMKLELAIIENIQRQDLNVVDRARAFDRLAKEFGFKHNEIAKKVGKSREYVTNTMRILTLPVEIVDALSEGKISEGHTRPLMMLIDKPEEQMTLFREIMIKKMSVREAERISRSIAFERARKKELMKDPALADMEEKLQEALGTRVYIERREKGGKILIDFFDYDDLEGIAELLRKGQATHKNAMLDKAEEKQIALAEELPQAPVDDRSSEEIKQDDSDLYSVKNFTV